ncbi:NF-kappa-B inhibitor zeta-like [Camarhynchus parvulus]|uniref:NF-kappa-B inhibitor zeta-like n=1 Tax=Geospiza parvula TaxID=87175 RepID=UPI00123800A6|nr:NF-kappa-B inhibitor zeta-like [Camarhynchus parvulus]
MLQTVCMSPELLANQSMSESEICGYSPGQGSPLPGETASPKSCFQQSPSLPDSGLTELNVASPKIFHPPPPPPPCNPPGMPAPADSELSSDPPQKRYMGVRVKMPVRELLRKIRLSKGLDPAPGKEAAAVKMVAKGSSGKTAEKRRSHPYTEKQLRQSKQSAGLSPRGLEDLDILVEVLQEDLNQSQLGEEPRQPAPDGFWQGFCTRELQSCCWQSAGSEEAAGGLQGPAELHPLPCGRDFHPILRGQAQPSLHGQQESTQRSGSPGMVFGMGEDGGSWWVQDDPLSSQEGFPRNSPSQEGFSRNSPSQECLLRNSPSQEGFPRNFPPQKCFLRNSPSQEGFLRDSPLQEGFSRNSPSQEGFPRNSAPQDMPAVPSLAEMLLEAPRGSPDVEGHLRPTPNSFTRQDLSALSFFQFQLHREENLLRSIPEEELLAADEHGNRLLHKAVAQGRRALTFALARRFASLNKIDEKDAEKRTALHLAAEKNQHLMVSDLISLGANVNEQDSSGKTPLHLCAENGYLRVLQVLKSCKSSGVCVEVDLPDHHGLTPLHCAALAHTVLVAESQSPARDSGAGRLLRLRRAQILEGILCLLQMGAKPHLQVLNSCPTSTPCLKLEENTELMCLLQTHKAQAQDVPQESCSLLDAPRGTPAPPAADNSPGLCSLSSSQLLDVLLEDPAGPEECREQILSPPNSTAQPPFLGILNPITCISSSVTLLFLLTPQHFPLYDVNNLYNTNAEFDWGDFRSLREEIREIPRNSQKFLLFLFQFQAPGTYVLQLSSNKHKRMYVRAMPWGARCPQAGPFLPSSPGVAVRLGIASSAELRLSPDWAATAALSSALLLLLAASLAPAFEFL